MTQKNERLYSLILENPGNQKLLVVKAIKEITAYGLKESKDIVDSYPSEVYTFTSKNNASMAAQKLNRLDAGVKTRVVDKRKDPDFFEKEIEVESNYFIETDASIVPSNNNPIFLKYSGTMYVGHYDFRSKIYKVGTSPINTESVEYWLKPV